MRSSTDAKHNLGEMAPPRTRTQAELRRAALNVAADVIEDATVRPRDRERVVRELLSALGILKIEVRVHVPCGGNPGTLAGYRWHLRAYETPCNACVNARQAELDERWSALGITGTSEVVVPV